MIDLERVQKACEQAAEYDDESYPGQLPDQRVWNWDEVARAATKAVLEDLMEPSEDMLHEGQKPCREEHSYLTAESMLARWRAMLKHLLKELGARE